MPQIIAFSFWTQNLSKLLKIVFKLNFRGLGLGLTLRADIVSGDWIKYYKFYGLKRKLNSTKGWSNTYESIDSNSSFKKGRIWKIWNLKSENLESDPPLKGGSWFFKHTLAEFLLIFNKKGFIARSYLHYIEKSITHVKLYLTFWENVRKTDRISDFFKNSEKKSQKLRNPPKKKKKI